VTDDHDEFADLRSRLRTRLAELRSQIPDTPGHRARMELLRSERKRLVAMVPTTRLRTAIEATSLEHGHDVDRSVVWAVGTVIREWDIFALDLRSLLRELHEGQTSDPIPDDQPYSLDASLFRPLDLPDRMSRALLRHSGGATTWLAHCRAELVRFLNHLVHERAGVLADELIEGFSANLRAAVEASGGTLHVYGYILTKTDRGYTIARDEPPPSPDAS